MLASLVLVAGLTAGVSGCAQAGTTSAGSTSIAASDLERIASGNTSRAGASSDAASSTSGASGSGQFVVPEAAKAHTKDGAVAFVKFYWDMLEKLDVHPQAGVIPKFASADCKSCKRQEQHTIELAREHGQAINRNGKWGTAAVRPDSTADSVVVQMSYTDAGGSHVVEGRSKEALPLIRSRIETRADWVAGRWVIGEMGSTNAP